MTGEPRPSNAGPMGPAALLCGALVVASAAAQAARIPAQLVSKPLPGLRADVATLMMQGASGGGVDLAVAAEALIENGERRLEVVVEVAGEEAKIRVKVEDDVIVFPADSKGRIIAAQGIVEAIEMSREDYVEWLRHLADGQLRRSSRAPGEGRRQGERRHPEDRRPLSGGVLTARHSGGSGGRVRAQGIRY